MIKSTHLVATLFAIWLFNANSSLANSNDYNHDTPLSEVVFVSFDVETTGFDPASERILELGAVKFRDGKVIEQKSWLINPEMRIHFAARRVHGISSRTLKDKEVFATVYPEIVEFFGDAVLLAHNASFDVNFMSEEIKRNKLAAPANITIDTLSLFRKWFPQAPAHNLMALVEYTGVTGGQFHRGLDDAFYVVEVFIKGREQHSEYKTLGDLIDASGGYLRFQQ